MKKSILQLVVPAVAALFFITVPACNQSGKNQDQAQSETHEHAQDGAHEHEGAHEEGHEHESMGSDSLTLNNGVKWESDEPTDRNAGVLVGIGDQFSKKSNRTLEDYHTFGNDINTALNTMIRECTMEGEADMALHYWFLPVLEQTGTLRDATDTTGLSSVTSEMTQRLRIYGDYFERGPGK